MRFAVLYSKKDEAGRNIGEWLGRYYLPHVKLVELDEETVNSENADREIIEIRFMDFIIFASKHQSKEKVPSLSIHAPGNWRNADFGGKPGKVCKTSALAMKFLFQRLAENAKQMMPELEHNITLEVTHHGPLIENIPCCFIEIGSSIENWKDKKLGEIIAKTIGDFQNFEGWKSKEENKKLKAAVAIGGPHYAPNFSKIQLSNESKIAVSHIIPEYSLPLTENMLKEAIEKTSEHIDLILLDWKGCGKAESRQSIMKICEKAGVPVERTERVEK